MKKKLTKAESEYIGPRCLYIAGENTSPSGKTWKQIQEDRDSNRIQVLQRAGLEINYHNMFELGDRYIIDSTTGEEKLVSVYCTLKKKNEN